MRRFARLYAELDAHTAADGKLAALQRYLAEADPGDAAWAVFILAGGLPRQLVPAARLRAEAGAAAGLPDWLFEASYRAAGDLAETIAQVLPPPTRHCPLGLSAWLTDRLLPLRGAPAARQAACLRAWWDELPATERFVLIKLIGGPLRVGVSPLLLQCALARHAGLDHQRVAQRMTGWTDPRTPPSAERLAALLAPEPTPGQADGQPYPFCLAPTLQDAAPDALAGRLGPPDHWLVEWRYGGIRAQLVRRAGGVWLWSRDGELITERFPEVVAAARDLPDGLVLDGELLAWQGEAPAPWQRLQQRIDRVTLSRKLLAEVPVRFVAGDLLEVDGQDLRAQPQRRRRERLERLLAHGPLPLSPTLTADSWPGWAALHRASRQRGAQGLVLKHRDATYTPGGTGTEGLWWTWPAEPFTVDAVLVYAQAGQGRHAGLHSHYSFAVWSRPPADANEATDALQAIARREPPAPGALQLVPIASADAGLNEAESSAVEQVIRDHTLQKFGPARSLRPTLVIELGFEGIARSARRRSGVALQWPRTLRIRHDKALHEAAALQNLLELLPPIRGVT